MLPIHHSLCTLPWTCDVGDGGRDGPESAGTGEVSCVQLGHPPCPLNLLLTFGSVNLCSCSFLLLMSLGLTSLHSRLHPFITLCVAVLVPRKSHEAMVS